MQTNVGTIDRILRAVVGLVLIALVFVGPQTPWGWIGIVPLATALIGFCPAYRLFGLRTCPLQKQG
jgi:ABC-type polysaccharide/polyol phosphate export permease